MLFQSQLDRVNMIHWVNNHVMNGALSFQRMFHQCHSLLEQRKAGACKNNFKVKSLYLIKDTTVSHHSALGMHMLIRPFPFDTNNPLYLRWDDNLPDQLSGQVLTTRIFGFISFQITCVGFTFWLPMWSQIKHRKKTHFNLPFVACSQKVCPGWSQWERRIWTRPSPGAAEGHSLLMEMQKPGKKLVVSLRQTERI